MHTTTKTMREIKFRVWNNKDQKWDDPSLIEVFNSNGILEHLYDPESKYTTIQQYTGLKDKNGVEIYEGDIVEFSRWNSPKKGLEDYLCKSPKKIVWGFDYGEFPNAGWSAISLSPSDLEEGHTLNWMDARNITIVGNIHENPELLKND